jgi:hypothetical protein
MKPPARIAGLIAVAALLAGCAGSGGYSGGSVSGGADDPRVAMLQAAKEIRYGSQQTFALRWKVVDLANGQQMLLPEVETYQPIQPPDIGMALLELSKDPWPGRLYAIGSGIVSAGMAATGFEAVRQVGKMGRAVADAAPSVTNSGTMVTSHNSGAGSSAASPLIKTIGGDSVEKHVGGTLTEAGE